MLFQVLGQKKDSKGEESSNSSGKKEGNDLSASSSDDIPTRQTITKITRTKISPSKISNEIQINIPKLQSYIVKKASKRFQVHEKVGFLVAQAVIIRMVSMLKSANEFAKVRCTSPFSENSQYFVSDLPMIDLCLLSAERNPNENVEKLQPEEKSPEMNNFLENITSYIEVPCKNSNSDDDDPNSIKVLKHAKIKKYPKDVDKILPPSNKKQNISIKDVLEVLREDQLMDPKKILFSVTSSFLAMRKNRGSSFNQQQIPPSNV